MTIKSQPPKNSLTIHLAESVVFLRPGNVRSDANGDQGQFSILRGLLILDIVKPTRISSIEIELQGRTRQIWHTEVALSGLNSKIVEDDKIFSASTVLFRASSGSSSHSDRLLPVTCRDKEVPEQWVHTPVIRNIAESPKRHMKGLLLGKWLGVESRASGNEWKEFQPGTYTYPILFTIPCDSPPTLECEFGNVSWHLEAQAHRPGAFEPNLMAVSEVILIASPNEDDAGVTESMTVEREWSGQLQYSVYISGRRFYPGATLSIHFAIVPLIHARIRQITVFLEEHAQYHCLTNLSNRVAPVRRYLLLCVQQHPREKANDPTLRHTPDDNDHDTDSHPSLYSMFAPYDEPPKLASSLMGRGPWTFRQELDFPSCQTLHYTNENWRSHITITHALKIVMRMQVSSHDHIMGGGQTRTQKVFDVVVKMPVQIHSNPECIALPEYTKRFETSYPEAPTCPCDNTGAIDTNGKSRSQQSIDIDRKAIIPPSLWPKELFDRNTQFERLVSGQESEIGESPPPYDSVTRNDIRTIYDSLAPNLC